MSTINASFSRDNNRIPITNLGIVSTLPTITYAAGTTGAIGATTLATVTGVIAARVFALCGVDLAGATATISVGVTGNAAALIAQTTATNIDAGLFWVDTGPASIEALPAINLVAGNIIQTIGTAAISAGTLTYYIAWNPISPDGNLTF